MFTPSSLPRCVVLLVWGRGSAPSNGAGPSFHRGRPLFLYRSLSARLKCSGGSREQRVHPLRRPHAHRQVWRLAGLALRSGYGRGRRQGGARTRRSAAAAGGRNDFRQRPAGWRRAQSRAADFHPQRRSSGSSRLHGEQGVRVGHQVHRARIPGDCYRQPGVHAGGRNRVDVAASLLSRRALAGDIGSAIRNSSMACIATDFSARWRRC